MPPELNETGITDHSSTKTPKNNYNYRCRNLCLIGDNQHLPYGFLFFRYTHAS
jgi:hypothetical protein